MGEAAMCALSEMAVGVVEAIHVLSTVLDADAQLITGRTLAGPTAS
jgi:hypothetical protein